MRHIKSFMRLRKEADTFKSCMRVCEESLDAVVTLTERHFNTTARFNENDSDFLCVIKIASATEKCDGVQFVIQNETQLHDLTIPFSYGEYVFNVRANIIKAHKLGDDYVIDRFAVPYITKIHITPSNDTPIFIDKMNVNIVKSLDTMMPNVPAGIRYEIGQWFDGLKTLESFVIKKGKGALNEDSNSG